MPTILHIYSLEKLPNCGIILFSIRSRVMSVVKTKIWRTFSHVGVIYPSAVTGTKKPWISYLDEIYGMVSMPLVNFLSGNDFVDWVIRTPSVMLDEQKWTRAIKKNISRDSNLKVLPDGTIGGSFETELKHILGIGEDNRSSNNIGFVRDVLDEYCGGIEVSKQVSFEDDQHQFGLEIRGGSEDTLIKTVKQILGLVNLTTQSIEPPITYFMNPLLTDLSDTYYRDGGLKYPPLHKTHMESDREHVAEIVAKMFSAGLGEDESLFGHFTEEIDTTVAAKHARDEISREMVSDTISALKDHLTITKNIMSKCTREERDAWNGSLEDLFASFGVILTHLNHGEVNLEIRRFLL